MGILSGTKTYLCGPIEFDVENRLSWRAKMHQFLERLGVRVYDPLNKADWYPPLTKDNPSIYLDALKGNRTDISTEQSFEAMKFIVDVDLRYIHDCEWLICYLPKGVFTVGTIEELVVAAAAGKPIFVFGPDKFPSSWIVPKLAKHDDHHEVFFDSIEKLQEHIAAIDNGSVPLDPLKWIFLSYFNKNLNLKVK